MSKTFPGVRALNNVSFGLSKGSVKGLMGENGAGKSTLLKILSGAYRASSGEILIAGTSQSFQSTKDALNAGIAVIYQELNLVPEMSVAENLLLGHLPTRFGLIDRHQIWGRASKQLQSLGETFSPDTKIKDLSIGQRQMVEIAKALMHDAQIIAFDEPTSSLSKKETKKLFQTIKDLKNNGRVVLYVSHRMEEIFEICDNLTVLRDGGVVRNYCDITSVTRDLLITDMVGRSIQDIYSWRPRQLGETLLDVHDLHGEGCHYPASFKVRKGEILGFFGLVGAGRSELLKLLFGATRKKGGVVKIRGSSADIDNVGRAIHVGVMLCPEDRKQEGIIPIRSVAENINLSARRHWTKRGMFLNKKKEYENAKMYIERLKIKTPGPEQLIQNLSGGNQQKAILARWLSEDIQVLLMDEPTRGIDVGAKNEIYNLMYQMADQGIALIVVSSDLSEILGVCDRIHVMREGQIVGEFSRETATDEAILKLALPVANNNSENGNHD